MYIVKKTTQNRRDFHAIYKCEHCEIEVEKSGYDDSYFHESVIPNMTCDKCKKSSGGVPYRLTATSAQMLKTAE